MNRSAFRLSVFTSWLPLLLAPAVAAAQPSGSSLLFTPVAPCRILDTRTTQGGQGPLQAGTSRTINVVGSNSGDFTSQGGHPGGCGIPGFANGRPRALAVVVTFVAVAASGPGDLRAWPSDEPRPNASVLNYTAEDDGLNIANAVVVPLRRDRQGGDLTVLAEISGTNLVADVTGYFGKPPGLATVAQANGDYADPVAAMNDLATWCPSPSASNPCLLRILPGVYSIGAGHLTMQPHVDVEGSGEGVTKITGTGGSSLQTGTLIGADAAELRAITIENTGDGTAGGIATAIFDPSRVTQVTALASGAGQNFAVAALGNTTSGTPFPYPVEMNRVTAVASGGTLSIAVALVVGGSAHLEQVKAVASNASGHNAGISLETVFPILHDVQIDVRGAGAVGISCDESGPRLAEVRVSSTGTGISTTNMSTLNIERSTISGLGASIAGGGGPTVLIAATQLAGPIQSDSMGFWRCIAVYDAGFNAISCPPA